MNCGCNNIKHTPEGGLKIGGSATVLWDQWGLGGLSIGGSALIDSPHPLDGMILCLPLFEGDSPFVDRSPSHLDGVSDNPPYPTDGVACQTAQHFIVDSGIGQTITIENDSLNDQAFTLEFWLSLDLKNNPRTIFAKGEKEDQYFSISTSSLNHLIVNIKTAEGTIQVFSQTLLEIERFYWVSITYNKGTVKIFLNGVLNKTQETGRIVTNSGKGFIGSQSNHGFFNGVLQEIRMYPDELDENFILAERKNFCGSFYSMTDSESVVTAT